MVVDGLNGGRQVAAIEEFLVTDPNGPSLAERLERVLFLGGHRAAAQDSERPVSGRGARGGDGAGESRGSRGKGKGKGEGKKEAGVVAPEAEESEGESEV